MFMYSYMPVGDNGFGEQGLSYEYSGEYIAEVLVDVRGFR